MRTALYGLLLFLLSACQPAPLNDLPLEETSSKAATVQERQADVDRRLADFSYFEEPLLESTEGGTVGVYADGEEIQKVEAIRMGEMGKSLEEYYFVGGLLDSAFITETTYNRPIYWDEQMAAESGDAEVFDLEKAVIKESFYDYSISDSSEDALKWKSALSQLLQDFFRD